MTEEVLEKGLKIGPCMDICGYGGKFYAIQNSDMYKSGRLCVFDTDGNVLYEYTGIGNARQICIKDGIAAISAREDGLWLFDVENGAVLLSHFQTVEYATGITVCGKYAFVSCRQYGVEVIDIGAPRSPVHITNIRIGEVQSACVCDGYLFGGVWGDMNVAVVDIHDLSAPRLVTRIPLSGKGDGVVADHGRLYAAIGHHRRGIKNANDPSDELYGMGNGFEVFDISDIENIRKIKTVFTGKRYFSAFDTWKTYISGDRLFVTNSTLGLFEVDKDTLEIEKNYISHGFPIIDGITGQSVDYDAVTGIAVCGGKLAIATGRSDVYLQDGGYADICKSDFKLGENAKRDAFYADGDGLYEFFRCDGKVSDVCDAGEYIAVAAGAEGVIILDKDGRVTCSDKKVGFCNSVSYRDGILCCAFCESGISVYRTVDGRLCELSNIKNSLPALQVKLCGDHLLACLGCTTVIAVSLEDPENPITVDTYKASKGILYGYNFASHTLKDGTALLFWHRAGLVYFDPKKEPKIRNIFYDKRVSFMGFGPENGIDTDGERIFYNLDGGIIVLPMEEGVNADDLEIHRGKAFCGGKITYCDGKVIACEAAKGIVTVTDISDIGNISDVAVICTNATVGKPFAVGSDIYIPGGYAGLLKLKI